MSSGFRFQVRKEFSSWLGTLWSERPPRYTRALLETSYVAPQTPTEQTLAAIWQEVLGVEQVGTHDNFFDLGGHSLLATQVISRVRSQVQVEVPLRNFFDMPTIERLAQGIEGLGWVNTGSRRQHAGTGPNREEGIL